MDDRADPQRRAGAEETSIELGAVGLVVDDLAKTGSFYEGLGLETLRRDRETWELGSGGRPLVVLRRIPGAGRDPRQAGLFHLALRVPDRPALAAVLRHLAATGVRLQGMSDHRVSEALYLADPEGNGIEIYADRPRAAWYENDRLAMTTVRLDVDGLMGATGWPDAAPLPQGTVMGHVHLESVDPESTRDFYAEHLGFELMARYPQAVFLSRDGYHHHIAGNAWNGRSRPRQQAPETQGLDYVTLFLRQDLLQPLTAGKGGDAVELVDPAGIRLVLRPLPAV